MPAYYYLASTYGSSNYDTATYNGNTTSTSTSTSSGGSLADTGQAVIIP